ncbi:MULTISPECIES: substrate-binding periplasmic protein [Prauserella salsuginis group]|uniref:Substrate-binding periplasmic protein n=1 Tax=Prauserella salsuginis TaxID=387889 RepID=A0ABW6G192_9PSEU|nr:MULTISPECIES: ABC transporter substrate-binding protein [Prauserella salsuginis group]MCR3722110.1 amino acid ABC transporter substrate-binding protein, PAAT family [Prauserella flava]MCR3736107.1 amino acid ABC transporter substrate-binding protein, PAAT family [Prauserella salsuginis]
MFRLPQCTKATGKLRRTPVVLIGIGSLITASACGLPGSSSTVPENCKPTENVQTLNEGELTVLVAEHPPFVSMSGNELTGIEGELIKDIASDLCLELDATSTSFSAVIEGLQSGRADLSAGNWTVNDQRRKLFEVSDGIYTSGMGIVTRDKNWSSVEELEGKPLGTPQGYLWVEQLNDVYGADNVRQYQTDTAVLDDVNAGRIEAGIVSLAANTWRLQQDQYSALAMTEMKPTPQIPYTQEPPTSVALIAKGNTALKKAANASIKDYYESGELGDALEEAGLDPDTAYPGGD